MTLYIICASVAVVCGVMFFFLYEGSQKTVSGIFKATATLMLAVPAYYEFAVSQNVVYLLVALGITFSAAADFVIHFSFLPGMTVFAAAHLMYAPAFIIYGSKIGLSAVVFGVYILICAFALTAMKLPSGLQFPAVIYAAVLGSMFSFAFGAAFYGEAFGIIAAVSATLFVASDAMLAYGLGKERSMKRDVALMILYYAAQAGFALACVI